MHSTAADGGRAMAGGASGRIDQFKRDRGAERLVNRVTAELLPSRYELAASVPILHQGRPEVMEVHVLRR